MADTALPIGALDPAGALQATDKLEIERGSGESAEGLRTTVADIVAAAASSAQTGDMLLTVRDPGGGWLEQGAVYPQVAYPELFAMVGLLGDDPPGRNWASEAFAASGSVSAVARVSESVAIAVGVGGAIWRSTDQGLTWVSITSPTANTLNDVCALDGQTIVAVGASGVIIRSSDAGLTWTIRASNTTSVFRKVKCLSAVVILAVGDSNTVRRSTDGGITWTTISTSAGGATRWDTIVKFSASVLFIRTTGTTGYRSVDGGVTWTAVANLPSLTTTPTANVWEIDTRTAVIVGGAAVHRSVDAGLTWTLLHTFTGITGGNTALIPYDTSRAIFVPPLSGSWSITDDGGTTWAPLSVSSTSGAIPAGARVSRDFMVVFHNGGRLRSSPEYAYDPTTMFRTPRATDVRGYIKP